MAMSQQVKVQRQVRGSGFQPLLHLLHCTVQPVCQAAALCWERKETLDKEILHETNLAAFGWLEMFQKIFSKFSLSEREAIIQVCPQQGTDMQ